MKITINELRSVLRHLKDGNKNQKVFGIGNHKTGTTTLNYIMHGLGFNCAPQANLERDCTLETIKGNYNPLTKYIHHFDFFQDSPFAHANTYVAIDALFPKSKFIYTYRDSNEWFESNINYVAQWCKTQPAKLNRSHYASSGYISKDYMIKKNRTLRNRRCKYWTATSKTELESTFRQKNISKNMRIGEMTYSNISKIDRKTFSLLT